MAVRLSSRLIRPSLMGQLFAELRLAWRLLREPRVPLPVKALPFLALFYVLSPLDIIPDILPIVGQIDDLGILLMSVKLFLRFSPTSATDFHSAAIAAGRRYSPMTPRDVVIEANYKRG